MNCWCFFVCTPFVPKEGATWRIARAGRVHVTSRDEGIKEKISTFQPQEQLKVYLPFTLFMFFRCPQLLAVWLTTQLALVSSQQCNEDDHHPENGGYFIVGAAGESDRTNLDSAHGQKLPDPTWSATR